MPIFIELEREGLWVVDRRGEELNTSHVFFLKPINLYPFCISSTAILLTLYCPLTPSLQPLTPSPPLCLPVSVHSYPLPSYLQAFHTNQKLPVLPAVKEAWTKGYGLSGLLAHASLIQRGKNLVGNTSNTGENIYPQCFSVCSLVSLFYTAPHFKFWALFGQFMSRQAAHNTSAPLWQGVAKSPIRSRYNNL